MNREHPADRFVGLLGIGQVLDFDDVGATFDDPVVPRQASVNDFLFDIAGHFLRPEKNDFKFVVIDGGIKGTRSGRDAKSSLFKQIVGGFLETSFGQS